MGDAPSCVAGATCGHLFQYTEMIFEECATFAEEIFLQNIK